MTKRISLLSMAALSLVCFVAVTGAYIRGYRRWDAVDFKLGRGHHVAEIASDRGEIHLAMLASAELIDNSEFRFVRHLSAAQGEADEHNAIYAFAEIFGTSHLIGFQPAGLHVKYESAQLLLWIGDIVVPDWIFLILFAVLPVLTGFYGWRKNKRSRAGLCLHCGYDLRASPAACPECGRASRLSTFHASSENSWTLLNVRNEVSESQQKMQD